MKKIHALLCLLSGAALTLAFAPFNLYWLAVVSPAVLLGVISTQTARRAAWSGFLFGCGFFLTGVSWVFISIHRYGNTAIPLAALFTVVFVMALASFPAVTCYLYTKCFGQDSLRKRLLVFPCLWVLFEWVRSWFLTGFPWLILGYSQTSSPLKGFAPIVGVYGISWLLLFSSALLTCAFQVKPFKKIGFPLLFIWCGGVALSTISWAQPTGSLLNISLIQGAIPQQLKWDQTYFNKTITTYLTLTHPHVNNALIVWPEGAIPLPLPYAKPLIDELDRSMKKYHSTLITGIPMEAPDQKHFYNSVIALGQGTGLNQKRHLVPFGEYVPFEKVLRGIIAFFNIPMSSFIPGPAHQPNLQIGHTAIASFICYDIAFPNLVLRQLPEANLLLTISDDAWFGESIAVDQHLQIAAMRSLETARPQLFATNAGPSAFIDPLGKITALSPMFTPFSLTAHAVPTTGITPWMKIGESGVLGLNVLLLIFGVTSNRLRASKKAPLFQMNQ